MLPASTLRISGWLIYVFSVFTLMTGAPAFARVLITVDKSTQQMSVSVDGVPRYRFAVSTGEDFRRLKWHIFKAIEEEAARSKESRTATPN